MLVRGMHVQEPSFMQRNKNCAQKISENVLGMHANPGIDERGAGVQDVLYLGGLVACFKKYFEISVPRESFRCNLRL